MTILSINACTIIGMPEVPVCPEASIIERPVAKVSLDFQPVLDGSLVVYSNIDDAMSSDRE